jgi:hypothetical protein
MNCPIPYTERGILSLNGVRKQRTDRELKICPVVKFSQVARFQGWPNQMSSWIENQLNRRETGFFSADLADFQRFETIS